LERTFLPVDQLLSLHGQLVGVGVEAKRLPPEAQLHLKEAAPQQVLSENLVLTYLQKARYIEGGFDCSCNLRYEIN
jgi:hypothetical protein